MKIPRLVLLELVAVALVSCYKGGGVRRVQLSGQQIADRIKPATVQVVVEYDIKGTVAMLVPDDERISAALEQQREYSDLSQENAARQFFNIFYNDPASYLKEAELKDLDDTVYALGSGTIVTPDGYILTNAHVVKEDDEALAEAAVKKIEDLIAEQAKQMEQRVRDRLPGWEPTEEASERLKGVLEKEYAKHGNFHVTSDVNVIMPTSEEQTSDQVHLESCRVVGQGDPYPGKDIAVLKMNGADLPTAPMASSLDAGGIRTGAQLFVLAYPGDRNFYPDFSDRNRIQPKMTAGIVSSVKEMSGGWKVIETDVAMEKGNSGGPVLNDYGEVVGLATYGYEGRANFAESVDLARDFLKDQSVIPRESAFTTKFDLAVSEFERPGHGNASRMFRELQTSYPDRSGPRDFMVKLSPGHLSSALIPKGKTSAQDAAADEQKFAPRPSRRNFPPALAVIGVVAVVLIVVVAVVVLVNRS